MKGLFLTLCQCYRESYACYISIVSGIFSSITYGRKANNKIYFISQKFNRGYILIF